MHAPHGTDRSGGRAGPRAALWAACAAAMAVLAAPAESARRGQGNWELPNERYRVMNTFERAQYDKAAKLLREGSYKAAAAEFEKFNVQFDDSPNVSYVLFLRGLCLHRAKKRNTAIKIYNEVLDYFREDAAAAAPALFHKAIAYTENGETRKGLACLRELADDKKLNHHPLAAGAVRRLADHYWDNDQEEQAVRYWKQVVRDFAKTNRGEAARARSSVTAWYVRNGQWAAYERWALGEDGADDPRRRRAVAHAAWQKAYGLFRGKDKKLTAAERRERMRAFHTYFRSRKTWFDKDGQTWQFHQCCVGFALHCLEDKKETDRLLDEAMAYVQSRKNARERDEKLCWLVDLLRNEGNLLRARHCISKISEAPLAAYKEYEILGHAEGKWKRAVAQLKNIESMGDAEWRARAESTRAWVYKDKTAEYEKAIALYQKISKPPGTLWSIVECYHRWRKLNEALSMLTEIINSFPDEAPKAYWRKAEYLHRAGKKKLAVKMARIIMKAYPKTPESSRAHQLLEKYGIATGGGVIDKD